jgi:hypothetical protein
MKRSMVLVATMTTILLPTSASAAGLTTAIGGGTGSFGTDLDGDGRVDGSQFGLAVTILGGGRATGQFLCLMAGRSQILGLSVMSVQGKVTGGATNTDGSATFTGVATINLGNGQIFRGVSFRVTAWAGGPGSGMMQLSVIGAFDGVPGDSDVGNGNYDLPVETVRSGHIVMR